MKTPSKVRAAVQPARETALGLALLPCSARHYIALETLASPVIGAAMLPRRPTLADYAAAAVLLSLEPRAAADLAGQPGGLLNRVETLVDAHTLAELQACANAVTRRVAAALGIELKSGKPRAESKEMAPNSDASPAETPPDPR